jgi:flagellar basal-body rod modification protein FlgD
MSAILDAISSAGSSSAASAAAASAGAKPTTAAEMEDRFLKLLVTQMKNQDPLHPMDNAQVTTQLAQISTVSGIDKLNDTMKSLSSSFLAGQSLQAASMIGHDVLVSGSTMALTGGTAGAAISLAGPADSVMVTIVGAAGDIVRSVDLGAQPAGVAAFTWNGKNDRGATAADGTYSFQVKATQGSQQVSATPMSIGQVAGVNLNTQGLSLSVGGVGDVNLTDVKRIF